MSMDRRLRNLEELYPELQDQRCQTCGLPHCPETFTMAGLRSIIGVLDSPPSQPLCLCACCAATRGLAELTHRC
jgi:hypothetical protein